MVVGLDFNLVPVREQLGAEAKRFALQCEVDEVKGPEAARSEDQAARGVGVVAEG